MCSQELCSMPEQYETMYIPEFDKNRRIGGIKLLYLILSAHMTTFRNGFPEHQLVHSLLGNYQSI